MYALRADSSPIVPLQAVMGGIGGNQASLIQFDYGRLPEKWDNSIGGNMPAISDYPYCTISHHDAWGNPCYLYRHFGKGLTSGTFRGRALIWPRNHADWERNHTSTVLLREEFYIFFNRWFSIPRNVTNGISGPPRTIEFTEEETIISATDIGYAFMEILTDYHDFSED